MVLEVTMLNAEHSARDCGKIMCTVQICASTGQTRDIQLMVDPDQQFPYCRCPFTLDLSIKLPFHPSHD